MRCGPGLRRSRERENLASLSWRQTYRAIAAAHEDWSAFESTLADGMHPRDTE